MRADTLLPLLLDLLVKSVGVLAMASASALLLRRASAANRHGLWFAGLVALLLLPCTKLATPVWSYEWQGRPQAQAAKPEVIRAEMPKTPLSLEPVAVTASALPVNWAEVAVTVWLVGIAVMVILRLAVSWQVWKLARGSLALADDRVEMAWRKVAGERVALRLSSKCRVPMVIGVMKPMVLLPLEALQWTDARLEAALRHEWGHIRRRDCLTRLLADGLRAVYWLNPLVWVATRELRLAQEQACDDLVLGAGTDAIDYADQLVDIVRSLGADRLSARHALAMAQPSTLEARILSIVDGAKDRRTLSASMTVGTVGAIVAVLLVCGFAQFAAAEKPKNKAETGARLIRVASKFIEIKMDSPLPPKLEWLPKNPGKIASDGEILGVLTKDEAVDLVATLSQRKGVDLLSAPQVKTKSGARATVAVVRDFDFPTQWDKDAKSKDWIPNPPFESMEVGVTMEVEPAVAKSGKVLLTLDAKMVEFEGFSDLDAPKSGSALQSLQKESLPQGHRATPHFSVRKIHGASSLSPGDSVLMAAPSAHMVDGKGRKTGLAVPDRGLPPRQLLVLVTSDLVEPEDEPAARAEGGTAKASANAQGFKVVGAVKRQGIYDIPPGGIHLQKAIEMAGGLTPMANSKRVRILRKSRLNENFFGVDLADNPPLEPGDVISTLSLDQEISDQYFDAYLICNEADHAAEKSDFSQAITKYTKAREAFEAITKNSPEWKPDMIKMRLDKIANAMASAKAKLKPASKE